MPDKKRDPLQVLADKFNEQWADNFTEGDHVVVDTLWKRIADNPQVADTIRRDGRQVFESSLLPKVFDEEARRANVENTDSFTSLFEDSAKYHAMMNCYRSVAGREVQVSSYSEVAERAYCQGLCWSCHASWPFRHVGERLTRRRKLRKLRKLRHAFRVSGHRGNTEEVDVAPNPKRLRQRR